VLGEGHHGLLAAGVAQVAQRGAGEVVVSVRESGPAGVGERVRTRGSAPAALGTRARFALDEKTIDHEGIEVPSDRSRREVQVLGKCGRALRTALEDGAGDGIPGALLAAADFHNISMTYFGFGLQPTPELSALRRRHGC
jgi:hypothetical protein